MSLLNAVFNTRYSKYPMFLQYVPGTHKVTGKDYLESKSKLLPGDIILRGHDNYISKFFIPGKYSHSGIYLKNDQIIHSIVKTGVIEDNLIDFMRCDRLMVLRCNDSNFVNKALDIAQKLIGSKYDNELEDNDNEFYCHEFTAKCYQMCDIKKIHATTLFGLIKKNIYCADSFIKNKNFTKILEIDWKL